MLRTLGSPKRASRFAASTTTAGGKSAPQELSSLGGDAASPAQQQQAPTGDLFASEAKATPEASPSKKKKGGKWSLTGDSSSKPTSPPVVAALNLNMLSKEDAPASNHNAHPKDDPAPGVQTPSPLLRTPRMKGMLDDGSAKATSPIKKSPTKTKRDSLGLKSLMAKRDKAKAEMKTGNEEPKESPKKSRKPADDEDEDVDGTPALSPIRRKPRPPTALAGNQSSTATIRDATSLLTRSKRLDSSRADGIPPLQQPEVHIIGEIVGGEGFGKSSDGYCCKWSVDYGNQWVHIAGDQVGQTQIDYPDNCPPDEGFVTWAHPLDLHFATTVFHGWPKILLQVWRVDSHMKMNVVGYGFVHVPFTPGHHQLTVSMWRPMGTSMEELGASLIGHTPELLTDEVLFNTAWAERCRLRTIATGRVQVDLGVIVRNFHAPGSRMDM